MTFENQLWLLGTPVIVVLAGALFAFGLRRRETLLTQFAAARLLDQLTEKASHTRSLLKAGLILLAFALIGIALARPTFGVAWIERKARGLDIVFVLDSSKSMLATDLRPTRLERAKLAIMDLVQRLESDHIGLVAFAGNAFLQTPPTLDYAAFRENLESIGYDTITRGGSDLGLAIREAAKAFPQDNNFKVVVLLTDGEDQAQAAIDSAREVAQQGIHVYAIGIGTPEGVYLKTRNAEGSEEFIRDANGQPVRSQLDEATLQQIAQLTGGSYRRLSDQSLDSLYNAVIATLPREERASELQEARIERFQWALAAACALLVLESFIRRRRSAARFPAVAWIAGGLLCAPAPAEAQQLPAPAEPAPGAETQHAAVADPRQLYNQAYERLSAGAHEEAKRLYAQVIETSTDLDLERDALYNMAHATQQIGEAALQAQDFPTAIQHWKEAEALFLAAHQIDSTDTASTEDAAATAARREALEALIEAQQPQDQAPSEDDEQQASDEPSEDSQQDDSQTQQSDPQDESESSEQQDAEQQGADDQASNSEQSSEPQGGESESGQDGAESSESQEAQSEAADDSESEASGEQSGAESTADPAEDMQQQAEEPADDEPPSPDDSQAPQPSAGSEGEPDDAAEPSSAPMAVEGMSLYEAQALLDSLRDAEQLLPFSEPSETNRRANHNSEIRDW